jgi:hypothetical protein
MLASVLNSPVAVLASIQVVRAFIASRREILRHEDLREWLRDVERRLLLIDLRGRRHEKALEDLAPLLERIATTPMPETGFESRRAEASGILSLRSRRTWPRKTLAELADAVGEDLAAELT